MWEGRVCVVWVGGWVGGALAHMERRGSTHCLSGGEALAEGSRMCLSGGAALQSVLAWSHVWVHAQTGQSAVHLWVGGIRQGSPAVGLLGQNAVSVAWHGLAGPWTLGVGAGWFVLCFRQSGVTATGGIAGCGTGSGCMQCSVCVSIVRSGRVDAGNTLVQGASLSLREVQLLQAPLRRAQDTC